MCVRALRITVLKSAGNCTRGECHNLSAEKIHRVKCFMFSGYEIVTRSQFSNAGTASCVRKFQAVVNASFINGHSRAVDLIEKRVKAVPHDNSPVRTNCVILGSPPMSRSHVIDP